MFSQYLAEENILVKKMTNTMTFQIQIYWRVMAPFFFFKDFGLEEKPNFKKSCDLATSTFDPLKKYRSIFESKKNQTLKKSICGAREKTVKSEIEK